MKRYYKEKVQTIFHHHLTYFFSLLLYFISIVIFDKGRKVKFILRSIRFCGKNKASLIKLIKLKEAGYLSHVEKVDAEYKSIERRVIELSEPIYSEEGLTKKGVLLITFTSSFKVFLNLSDFEDYNNKYLFILEPSWTGYADIDILNFCEKAKDLIIQATDVEDRALIQTLYPSVAVADIGASNWVNQSKFIDLKLGRKEWDLLYVANNNPVKRVFRFIEVVESMLNKRPNLAVRILCAGWGGSADEVFSFIQRKGLDKNILISNGVSQTELLTIYNQSKASVLFSLKEGSNRVLFESMACNTPVFCLAENRGVNKAYINEFTGLLSYDSACEQSLIYLIDNYESFSARKWVEKNLSPEVTTERMKDILDSRFLNEVNSNLKVKINNPEVEYLNN